MTPVSRPDCLTMQDLGFTYPGAAPVLSGLSLSIGPGLCLVRGGDGRGKTTLLKLMAGTLAPTAGQLHRRAATVCHADVSEAALDPVRVDAWWASQAGEYPGWSRPVADRLIEALGLAPHVEKPFYMLSTGSRRKVGFVAAAASGAALTLIEQPLAALDARSCRVVVECLAEAASSPDRAWVVADYEAPAALDWARQIDLGD